MDTLSSNSSSTGLLPYETTTPEQRERAIAHMRHLSGRRFALLTDEDWGVIFDEFKPALLSQEAEGLVAVAEESLAPLTSWAGLYYATHYEYPAQDEQGAEQFSYDANYLARHLQAYADRASVLLAADPELAHPMSVGQMRDIIRRLAIGNTVAERLAQTLPPRIVALN